MDRVLYLVHASPTLEPLKAGYLKRDSCDSVSTVQHFEPSHTLGRIIFNEGKNIFKTQYTYKQFPGVYFSLVTSENRVIFQKYAKMFGRYLQIFSKRLLEQNNYHLNVQDSMGTLSEKNTQYPWNLEAGLDRMQNNLSDLEIVGNPDPNEVVFHDDVLMTYCVTIIDTQLNPSWTLPKESLETENPPNRNLLPFQAQYTEPIAVNLKYGQTFSSIDFIRTLARVANIDPANKSRTTLIREINERSPFQCKHRNYQNIQALVDYTQR